jgi:rhamnosyltransferase
MKDKTIAIVISFNGGNKTLETIERLRLIVSQVLVVDNGSENVSINLINGLVHDNVKVTYLGDNHGIGYALNVGAKYALENGFEWILTMDQDSLVNPDFIKAMENFISNNPDVRSLAPSVRLTSTGALLSKRIELMYAITSGHLFRTNIFNEIGFYNQDLFIVVVDFDFCLRLKSKLINTYLNKLIKK